MGAVPVYMFLPAPGLELPLTPERAAKAAMLKTLAARAGFVVIDLSHLFDNQTLEEVVACIVPHSNAKAHALIADALYKGLMTDPRIAFANLARSASASAVRSSVTQPSS